MDSPNNSRVLVLGGSGFIGWSLCQTLVKEGLKVRCFALDRPAGADNIVGKHGPIDWILGEFSNEYLVEKALQGVDYIFHLISTTIPPTSNSDLEVDLTSNVLPTLKLLKSAVEHDVKKIIFISSGGAIYGIPNILPVPENHEKKPICGYGIHKLAIEKYLHLFNHLHGLDYSVLRLANPYGKHQISNRSQGVIGNFVFKAIQGQRLDIWGDGMVSRDFIYIDDVVEAFFSAMNFGGKTKIFNVGSGEGHSLLDIIKLLEEVIGHPLDVRYKPGRPVDVPVNVLDAQLAINELGWRPKTDLKAGIKLMYDFGREQLSK